MKFDNYQQQTALIKLLDEYNLVMDERVIRKLLDINMQFYQTFGEEFSATRGRIQPGVRKVLDRLKGTEKILDLGCGNGEVARQLIKLGHQGEYTGLDLSSPMLEIAKQSITKESFHFFRADLSTKDWDQLIPEGNFDVIFAYATLHHFPSHQLRLDILRKISKLVNSKGYFTLSNWQFLKSPRLKARIQAWDTVNIDEEEVEEGDFLLDWKRGGTGYRYVHHFREDELENLANESGFQSYVSFLSDGHGNNLSLYQCWKLI